MSRWLGLPPDWSRDGHQIDSVITLVHWAMLALFVVWMAYFVYVLIRFRAGAHPEARHEPVSGRFAMSVVAAIALAEVGLLVVVEIPLWARRVHDIPAAEAATHVRVVAQQFAWNFHYPGEDGVFGATSIDLIEELNPLGLDYDDPNGVDDLITVNQLHVPVDRPVLIELTSMDVIHGFFLPYMRVKQDAIPGQVVRLTFTPILEGESEVACAQLCGLSHYSMRGVLTVESQEDFESWYQEELEYM